MCCAFQPVGPQHVLVPGTVPPLGQDFLFPLVALHKGFVALFPQPVNVPLNGSATGGVTSNSCHFIICKLPEGAACPVIQVVDEDVKHFYHQCQSLGHTTGGWPPVGLCAAAENPISPAVQPVFSLPPHPFI